MLNGVKFIPENAEFAVVFLHGFGSNGEDLMGLAPEIEGKLEDNLRGKIAYFSPNGISETEMGGGYQWFSDNNWTFRDRKGMDVAQNALWEYMESEVFSAGILAKNVVVIGFSQGTMTALFAAPRWPEKIAGIIGCSGRLMWESELKGEDFNKFPILLMHGTEDDVVPADETVKSAGKLEGLGFEVEYQIFSDLAHGVNGDEIGLMVEFLGEVSVT